MWLSDGGYVQTRLRAADMVRVRVDVLRCLNYVVHWTAQHINVIKTAQHINVDSILAIDVGARARAWLCMAKKPNHALYL